MKNILNKKFMLYAVSILTVVLVLIGFKFKANADSTKQAAIQTADVKSIDSQIMAEGSIRSQNEATLHFITGGKVTYLPFKEGDNVKQGQTIASLDTFTIQQQLQAALNSARIANTNYDQTVDNSKDKYLKAQITTPYNLYTIAKIKGDDKTEAINNAIERIVQISESTKDNAQVQVEIAKYAFSLAAINSPINGQLVHEDIATPNVVATTTTAFTVMDPSALIFKANIPEDEINYVEVGTKATIKLNGQTDTTVEGNVIKIYPDKITLPNGENVYQADISSPDLIKLAKYKQGGVALINSITNKPVILAPTWLILGGNHIWVLDNNQPVLRQVTTRDTNGGYTEITTGLSQGDKLILDPKSIISDKYLVL